MNKKYLRYLNALLVVSGFVLLYLTFFVNKKEENWIYTNENFEFAAFLNQNNFNSYAADSTLITKKSKLYAVFLINDDDCSVCTRELYSFSDYIDEKLSQYRIQQIILVASKAVEKARRFATTLELNKPVLYGFDSTYLKILVKYGAKNYSRQLIIIDSEHNKIVMRVILLKGIVTDNKYKEEIFKKIFK